jgi:ABC-type transport system involved in cytochrome bd biosynthesis fused ATPase/permease subunit
MKNAMIHFITLIIGFISFVFVTGLGLVLTATLLIVGLIAKPFLIKNLKQKLHEMQDQSTAESTIGEVYEGKFEQVD